MSSLTCCLREQMQWTWVLWDSEKQKLAKIKHIKSQITCKVWVSGKNLKQHKRVSNCSFLAMRAAVAAAVATALLVFFGQGILYTNLFLAVILASAHSIFPSWRMGCYLSLSKCVKVYKALPPVMCGFVRDIFLAWEAERTTVRPWVAPTQSLGT